MKPPIRIDNRVIAGGQPDEADFAALHAQGYRSIINLRRPGEPNHDPVAEGEVARRAGFTYVNIPVDSKNPSTAQVDEVQRAMAAAAAAGGACFIH